MHRSPASSNKCPVYDSRLPSGGPVCIPEPVHYGVRRKKCSQWPGLGHVPTTQFESGSDIGSADGFVTRRWMFAGKADVLENSEWLTWAILFSHPQMYSTAYSKSKKSFPIKDSFIGESFHF